MLAGLGVEQLPVVLLSLVGLTDGTADNAAISKVVDAVIDEVAETQLLGRVFARSSSSTRRPLLAQLRLPG